MKPIIELPCNIGDIVIMNTISGKYEAEVIGFKITSDWHGIAIKVKIHNKTLGTRTYDAKHFGRTLFPKSDCE